MQTQKVGMMNGHPIVRRALTLFFKGLFKLVTKIEVRGLEHVPARGPLICASNHLHNIDPVFAGIVLPWPMDPLALTDLLRVKGTGTLLRLYGVIPVDRKARNGVPLELAVQALNRGRIVLLMPEGRISVTGALERARSGVAYLALIAGVPVLPIALAGTESALSELRKFRRPRLTITIGKPMYFGKESLAQAGGRRRFREVTDQVMYRIAEMLPERYRGVYRV
jgi:1-acyl-sn-glycerol-3-phosphate acyltransferase